MNMQFAGINDGTGGEDDMICDVRGCSGSVVRGCSGSVIRGCSGSVMRGCVDRETGCASATLWQQDHRV